MQDLAARAAREKRYRQSDKGKAKRAAAQAARRSASGYKSRDWRLKKYGLSEQDYRVMLFVQGGACAICHTPETNCQHGRLRIDHDHATGKIRGLLCHHCNVALGHLKDSPALLQRMIEYLGRNA